MPVARGDVCRRHARLYLAAIRDTDYRTKTFTWCRCGADGAGDHKAEHGDRDDGLPQKRRTTRQENLGDFGESASKQSTLGPFFCFFGRGIDLAHGWSTGFPISQAAPVSWILTLAAIDLAWRLGSHPMSTSLERPHCPRRSFVAMRSLHPSTGSLSMPGVTLAVVASCMATAPATRTTRPLARQDPYPRGALSVEQSLDVSAIRGIIPSKSRLSPPSPSDWKRRCSFREEPWKRSPVSTSSISMILALRPPTALMASTRNLPSQMNHDVMT